MPAEMVKQKRDLEIATQHSYKTFEKNPGTVTALCKQEQPTDNGTRTAKAAVQKTLSEPQHKLQKEVQKTEKGVVDAKIDEIYSSDIIQLCLAFLKNEFSLQYFEKAFVEKTTSDKSYLIKPSTEVFIANSLMILFWRRIFITQLVYLIYLQGWDGVQYVELENQPQYKEHNPAVGSNPQLYWVMINQLQKLTKLSFNNADRNLYKTNTSNGLQTNAYLPHSKYAGKNELNAKCRQQLPMQAADGTAAGMSLKELRAIEESHNKFLIFRNNRNRILPPLHIEMGKPVAHQELTIYTPWCMSETPDLRVLDSYGEAECIITKHQTEELPDSSPEEIQKIADRSSTNYKEEEDSQRQASDSTDPYFLMGLKFGGACPKPVFSRTADAQHATGFLISLAFIQLYIRGFLSTADCVFRTSQCLIYLVSNLSRVVSVLERLVLSSVHEVSSAAAHSVELFRLISFVKWPHIGKVSALRFSSAGFHYTGSNDTVSCHSCRLSLRGWTPLAEPLDIHQQRCEGRCQLIGDPVLSSNLPLTASHVGRRTIPRCTNIAAPGNADLFLNERGGASCFLKDPTTLQKRQEREMIDTEPRQQLQLEELWKYESYRLRSYDGLWHHNHIVHPRELARSGFYYTGPADRVQCAFCQGALRNWEQGDQPDELHAKHFNYCRLVQGHDVGNVPIPFWSLAETTLAPEGDFGNAAETRDPQDLGIFSSTPKYVDFAVESRRLLTFATWSLSHHLGAEALAQAGFFFTGNEDAVTCFFCNGTISGWSADSDPWVEHARRFPTCAYVLQVKGRSTVERQGTLNPAATSSTMHKTSFAVDPREIRARMDTPSVRTILNMDYPSDLVREVIQRRLSTTGRDHSTSEELLADVFAFHDEKQRINRPAVGGKAAPVTPIVVSQASATEPVSSSFQEDISVASAASAPTFDNPGGASAAPSDKASTSVATQEQPPDEENRQLKTQLTCKICMDAVVGIIFLPCGHLVSCAACAPALPSCPICRVGVRGTARVSF